MTPDQIKELELAGLSRHQLAVVRRIIKDCENQAVKDYIVNLRRLAGERYE